MHNQMFLIQVALEDTGKKYDHDLCGHIKEISNAKKDFITDIFVNLAIIDFRIKFLKWSIKNIHLLEIEKDIEKQFIKDCLERIKEAKTQNKKIQVFISNGNKFTLQSIRQIDEIS